MINELFEDKKDVIKEIESIIKDNLNITDYDAISLEIKSKKKEIIDKMNKDKYDELSKELENLNLQEYNIEKHLTKDSSSRTRFNLIKSKLYDDKAPLTGEFLNSVINKILVIDKEHIVYLIPKSQFLKTEDINLHIKRFLSLSPLFKGEHVRTHNNKVCKMNYSVVII